jgi:adenylylsulfate kinase-like enzyme
MAIYYLIGQPGSGKTTLAKAIMERRYFSNWFHIDGDDIRKLYDNKDYTKEGRIKNIILSQQIAEYLHSKGENVLMSIVSPYKEQRELFKKKIGDKLNEVYVHTSEVRGKESFFVEDYEQPTENYIDVCTDDISIDECVEKIFKRKYPFTINN